MSYGRSRRGRPGPVRARPAAAVALALAVIAAAAGAAWQGVQQRQKTLRHVAEITGGDPHAGQEAVLRYGCGSCHTIPGVTRARGLVGPPLAGFGSRVYVAGVLANTPDNVMSWIKDPPAASPRTAMPNLGVSDQDARDITAYLYTLTEGHW